MTSIHLNTPVTRPQNHLLSFLFVALIVLGTALISPTASASEELVNRVRFGQAFIDFREDSEPVYLNRTVNMGELSIESLQRPIMTFGRKLGQKWWLEVLLPFKPLPLRAKGKGGVIDGLIMLDADVWPVALTLQYYFAPGETISPYIGAGVNYSFINHEEINRHTATLLGIDRTEAVDAKNSFGSMFQLGVDIAINDNWKINLSTTFLELELDMSGYVYSGDTANEIKGDITLHKVPNMTVIGLSYLF